MVLLNLESTQIQRVDLISIEQCKKAQPREVCDFRSVKARRVMAGLWLGCLPLAVEMAWYLNVPYWTRVCHLCDRGRWKTSVIL